MTCIGVDGCKVGWFYARLDGQRIETGTARTLAAIVDSAPDGAPILVDIPIGLRDDTAAPRGCDTAARKLLGRPRASSVFPAPVRAILDAGSHAEATARSRALTGKGISQQAFWIMAKIREVDGLLATSRRARAMVRETHPELCFWALNGGRAMVRTKKTREGFDERMRVLRGVLPGADGAVQAAMREHRREEVARDDVVDALVALATAAAPQEQIRTAPDEPEHDSRGVPMEIVHVHPGSGAR